MSEQAVAAIREMLQPGVTLLVTASQIPTVPIGRKQIIVSLDTHGAMTEVTVGRLEGTTDNRSFIPIGCNIGPTDAEQLQAGSFVLWHQSAPETSRITYKIVDTVWWGITQTPDGLWKQALEGPDFALLAGELFDVVTAPGSRDLYRDWQILPKQHILAHPDKYPMEPVQEASAPNGPSQ